MDREFVFCTWRWIIVNSTIWLSSKWDCQRSRDVNHVTNQSACLAERRPDFEPINRARRNPKMLFVAETAMLEKRTEGSELSRSPSLSCKKMQQVNEKHCFNHCKKSCSEGVKDFEQICTAGFFLTLGIPSLLAVSFYKNSFLSSTSMILGLPVN